MFPQIAPYFHQVYGHFLKNHFTSVILKNVWQILNLSKIKNPQEFFLNLSLGIFFI